MKGVGVVTALLGERQQRCAIGDGKTHTEQSRAVGARDAVDHRVLADAAEMHRTALPGRRKQAEVRQELRCLIEVRARDMQIEQRVGAGHDLLGPFQRNAAEGAGRCDIVHAASPRAMGEGIGVAAAAGVWNSERQAGA